MTGPPAVYDFLFRKYDPSAGRWLSPDPYGWGAADLSNPQSINRYAYVGNKPLVFIDPLGLDGYNWAGGCLWYDYSKPLGELTNSVETVTILITCGDIPGWTPGVSGGGGAPGGGAGSGGGAPNNGNPNNTYPLLNTRNQNCGADASAALHAETGKILSGDWVGTTATGVLIRGFTVGGLTASGVAEGAAVGFAGRALYYGAKGLLMGATTGGACAISTGITSLYDNLTTTGMDY